MKCTINVMPLNHPETILSPPHLSKNCLPWNNFVWKKKSDSFKIGPWCQKGWETLIYNIVIVTTDTAGWLRSFWIMHAKLLTPWVWLRHSTSYLFITHSSSLQVKSDFWFTGEAHLWATWCSIGIIFPCPGSFSHRNIKKPIGYLNGPAVSPYWIIPSL